jgi:hypothetical protein
MSMMVFAPIFPFLSVLGGVVTGITIGLLLAVTIVAAYYRDIPFHLITRAIFGIILIGAAIMISFIVFRVTAGLPNFNLARSLSHIHIELVRDRMNYLLLGVAAGFLIIIATFLGGVANGSSSGGTRRVFGHSALPAWR